MARLSRIGRGNRRSRQHISYARSPLTSIINASITLAKIALLMGVFLVVWTLANRQSNPLQTGSAGDVSLNAESKTTTATDNISVVSINTPTPTQTLSIVKSTATGPDINFDSLADTSSGTGEDTTVATLAQADIRQNAPDGILDTSDTEIAAQVVTTQAAIAQTTKEEPTNSTAVRDHELVDEQWIAQLNPKHFIVQYGSTLDIEKLIEFIPVIKNTEEIAVYPFRRTPSGRLVYGIATGVHPNLESALASLEELSPEARAYNPWVRSIQELIEQINSVSF